MHTTYTNAAIASQRRADHEARAARHRQAKSVRVARSAAAADAERRSAVVATCEPAPRSWVARLASSLVHLGRTHQPAAPWGIEAADAS